MEAQDSLLMLQQFIIELNLSGVETREEYRLWAKDNDCLLCRFFDYKPYPGTPKMNCLVSAHFHPGLPLIGLNYTSLAHNLLYKYPEGWTPQLRMCRGITFSRGAELVAFCLPKFFNAGEIAETKKLPASPIEVLEKLDGHNGQIFWYGDSFWVKTRGSFDHRSAQIAQEILDDVSEQYKWRKQGIEHLTLIVEIIHPETHVICRYRRKELVLIAAYDNVSLADLSHDELKLLGKRLGIAVVKAWKFSGTRDLLNAVRDPAVRNKEGFVARFSDGSRVKFKYTDYLKQMIAEKLSYSYLMLRWMDGRLNVTMQHLPEEVLPEAEAMVLNLKKARRMRRDIKLRRKFLYELVPPEESTPYYRKVCRDFLRH